MYGKYDKKKFKKKNFRVISAYVWTGVIRMLWAKKKKQTKKQRNKNKTYAFLLAIPMYTISFIDIFEASSRFSNGLISS